MMKAWRDERRRAGDSMALGNRLLLGFPQGSVQD